MCFGATYSWAVFVEPLKQVFGKGQGAVQFPFSVFYIFFPFTMIFSGYILERTGVRLAAVIGILIFSGGWIISGAAGREIWIITLGIGLIGGIGVGIGYVIPIKLCAEWFPKHKGLATGLAVAGFGGGAALISQVSRYLMESALWSPFRVYKTLGICFVFVGGISAFLLKSPDKEASSERSLVPVKSTIGSRTFLLLYLGMFAGLCAGFAVIANLKHIFDGATPLAGATAVSLFAIFNALGRIVWGAVHDRTKGRIAILVNLLFQAFCMGTMFLYLKNTAALYVFASVTGFNYGGVLVLYAAEASEVWGSEKLPKVYGWIFSANIAASFSPVFAGFMFDRFGDFTLAFVAICLFMMLSSVYIMFQYTGKMKLR